MLMGVNSGTRSDKERSCSRGMIGLERGEAIVRAVDFSTCLLRNHSMMHEMVGAYMESDKPHRKKQECEAILKHEPGKRDNRFTSNRTWDKCGVVSRLDRAPVNSTMH